MGHFDVFLCLVPQAMENGIEYVPEDAFVVALGNAVDDVDYVVNHATARRISGEIATSINMAPEFTHQSHLILGTCEDTRDNVVKLLLHNLFHKEVKDDERKDFPQQCMIFASDKKAVVCKIIGSEDIHSVPEVARRMGSIVLVALKYAHKTSTISVASQFSTTFLSSFLGPARCHLWLLVNCSEKVENSTTVMREALAVRDAVRGFSRAALPRALEASSVRALLSARAASAAEAQSLEEWWDRHAAPAVDEAAALRTACAELRVRLAEGEERRVAELDAAGRESARLRQALREAERRGQRAAALEQRVRDLEAELAARGEEIRHRERAEDLRRDLEAAQTLVQSLEQKCGVLNEEIMENVVEFQQREMDWQAEVRRAIEECQQLRSTIETQGASMDVVREAVEASQALQEEELDELLGKIRAISAVNPSVCHRRVSPRASTVIQGNDARRELLPQILSQNSVSTDS